MPKRKAYKPRNPFIYEGYEGPDYFCDRTEETENIISSLRNGRNLTLVSPRKNGKTGLILHTFDKIKQFCHPPERLHLATISHRQLANEKTSSFSVLFIMSTIERIPPLIVACACKLRPVLIGASGAYGLLASLPEE